MADKSSSTDAPTTLAMGEPRRQCGAIAYRRAPKLEIMLVTSRETGRWVIPKGGLISGKTVWESAEEEAFEEAGVVGEIERTSLGAYDYVKFLKSGEGAPCRVAVFALAVTGQLSEWPEQAQRTTKWFDWFDAAEAVHESGLAAIIYRFGRDAEDTLI